MRLSVIVCALVLLFVLSGTAQAFMFVGEPVDGNSWRQRFVQEGVGQFDFLRVDWVSGSAFEPQVFRSFSVGGWVMLWESGTSTAWERPTPVTSVQWDIWFTGTKSSPVSFLFYAYLDDQLKEATRARWRTPSPGDANWGFDLNQPGLSNPNQDPTTPPVPEPATAAFLIAAGLLAMGGLIKRRSR